MISARRQRKNRLNLHAFYLILLSVSLVNAAAFAAPSLELNPDQTNYRISPFLEVLEDPLKTFSIQDVAKEPLAGRFTSRGNASLNLGPTDSVWWIRFTVVDRHLQATNLSSWVLDLSWDNIGSAKLYTPLEPGEDRNEFTVDERGNLHQSPKSALEGLRPFFPLNGPRNTPCTYHVRVETRGSLFVPAYIRTVEQYLTHSRYRTLFYGIYVGILLSIALYNFLFYVNLRQRVYLYYVFYVVFTILYFVSSVNLFQEWMLLARPDLDFRLRMGLLSLAVLPCFAFTRSFLLTQQFSPIMDYILQGCMIGWSVFVCLIPALPLGVLDVVSSLMGMLSPFFFVIAGTIRYRAGFQPARYYTVAWALLSISLSLYSLMHLGFVPPDEYVLYLVQSVSALESILLSYALADRIRTLREETEAARQSERRYRELAVTDELTQLYNARFFRTQLPLEIRKSDTLHLALSLILIDIDDFKKYNDTQGHLAGDNALRGLGVVVHDCVRDRDVPCRYGGEEFAVILPATDASEARDVAERIRLRYQLSRRHEGIPQGATISAGVTQYISGESEEDFIKRTDVALYEAKHSGKNCVILDDAR